MPKNPKRKPARRFVVTRERADDPEVRDVFDTDSFTKDKALEYIQEMNESLNLQVCELVPVEEGE